MWKKSRWRVTKKSSYWRCGETWSCVEKWTRTPMSSTTLMSINLWKRVCFLFFYHQSCFLAPQPNMVGLRAFTEENSQVENELAQVPEQEEPWQEYRKERSE